MSEEIYDFLQWLAITTDSSVSGLVEDAIRGYYWKAIADYNKSAKENFERVKARLLKKEQ